VKHDGDMVHGFERVGKAKYRNDWQAMIVLASDHAGLRPEFQTLEDEIVRTIGGLHDARAVMHYLREIRVASKLWREVHEAREREK